MMDCTSYLKNSVLWCVLQSAHAIAERRNHEGLAVLPPEPGRGR